MTQHANRRFQQRSWGWQYPDNPADVARSVRRTLSDKFALRSVCPVDTRILADSASAGRQLGGGHLGGQLAHRGVAAQAAAHQSVASQGLASQDLASQGLDCQNLECPLERLGLGRQLGHPYLLGHQDLLGYPDSLGHQGWHCQGEHTMSSDRDSASWYFIPC